MNSQVLVVDDSESFRRTVRELLGARGFRVLADAVDGPSALAAVAEQRPDGVLLDINLPGADGLAVAESLTSRYPGLRIVLTSSDVDHVPAEQLDACGARAFIPKTQLVAADLQRLLG
jgi:CheY-like chemotaxis protein